MAAAPVDLLEALSAASVDTADALECADWLGHSKRIRGWLDAFDASVTRRLDQLAADGESFGSEDTHTRCSGISSHQAAKLKQRSKTLENAVGFGDALADGAVTAEHVDRLASVAGSLSDEVRASLFDRSSELLQQATRHDPARFGRHCRDLARRLEHQAGITRDHQQHANTRLTWNVMPDGMYAIHARLHPAAGARLIEAINTEVAARIATGETAGDPDYINRTVDRARLAAEVLVDHVTATHQHVRPMVADISVIVDLTTAATGQPHDHTVCETAHAAPLPIDTMRTLLCNGRVTPVYVDDTGTVIDIGRTRRTPNRAQRRALRTMYRTCALAGCETGFDRCELHHIIAWEHGGPTDLANLVPVCSRHHHQIHTHHWQLELSDQRTLTIHDRDGHQLMVTTPDMPHPPPRQPQPAPAGHPHNQLAS